jgi:hypothetical protein
MTDRERHEAGSAGEWRQPPPPPPPVQPPRHADPVGGQQASPPSSDTNYWRPKQPDASAPASTSPLEPDAPGPYRPSASPEAADTAARTSPVPTSEVRRPGGAKWGIALVVVALAIGVTAAGIFLLTGSTSPSVLVGYAPANALAYGEMRFDLPGDQRAKVADFLSNFPGFDDRSTLEAKIAETLDLRLREATDGEIDYSTDIQPWFGGQVGFAVGELPEADDPTSASGALLLSVTDGARALAWVREASGATFESATYAGVEMLVHDDEFLESAVAVADGRVMIAGDRTSVEQALDTRGDSALGADPEFRAAFAAAPDSGVGFAFVDLHRYIDSTFSSLGSMSPEMPCGFDRGDLDPYLPAWGAFGVRVESDGLRLEASTAKVDGFVAGSNRAGGIAAFAPTSTLVLADGHEVGKTLIQVLDVYRDCPEVAEALTEAENALSMFGGVNGTIDWIGDAGFVLASAPDGGVEGGLLVAPTDAAKARERLTSVYNLLVLGGSQIGIFTSEEDYNGAQIRTISGNLEDLAALGGAGDSGASGEVEFAYTATDEIVVFGASVNFVKAALDAGRGESLADSERYQNAVGQVAAENVGIVYVDITKSREMLEQTARDEGSDLAEYETEVRPWLEPFDVLVQATVAGDPNQVRAFVSLK